MSYARPIVLLTGFGPFPRVPANATSILVPRIAEAAHQAFPGVRIEATILPTEWHAGIAEVHNLYRWLDPTIALHFGVAGRATGFEIEARGRNRCSHSLDAAGCLPPSERISHGGPEFLHATFPAAHIVTRLRRRGLAAKVSRDAGSYLCNALLYKALELGRHGSVTRNGFIHLPSTLVNETNPRLGPLGTCRLTWDDVVDGGLEIIAACLGRHAPIHHRRRSAR